MSAAPAIPAFGGAAPRLGPALWVALFGRETRYVGRLYAGRVFVFATLVLAVVLSLDAASHLSGFLADRPQPGVPSGLAGLGYYLLLRAGYNLSAVLPIATLVGVVWTEFTLALSRQRLMIANSGRAAFASLAPALLVGLAVGALQFAALAYVRPATVEAQAISGFRDYGPKFRTDKETGVEWISVENAVVAARVAFTDPPTLKAAVLYDLTDDGALRAIRTAARAVPVADGLWVLQSGTEWRVPIFFSRTASGGGAQRAERFDSLSVALALDPLWLAQIDIQPILLPQAILARLATAQRGVENPSNYRAAYQERFAALFYVLGMALLPAALAISWFLPGMGAGPMVRVIVWGIGAYFAASVFSQLGAFGYLPAPVSAWTPPVLFIGAALAVLAWRARGSGT